MEILGIGSIVAFCLGVGLWLFAHRDAPKTTTLLFLIAGTALGGVLGALVGQAVAAATSTIGSLTGQLIGVGGATLLAVLSLIATLEVVIKGMWPKKASPRRWHPWLALVLPTIIVAGSVPVLVQIMNALNQVASTVAG